MPEGDSPKEPLENPRKKPTEKRGSWSPLFPKKESRRDPLPENTSQGQQGFSGPGGLQRQRHLRWTSSHQNQMPLSTNTNEISTAPDHQKPLSGTNTLKETWDRFMKPLRKISTPLGDDPNDNVAASSSQTQKEPDHRTHSSQPVERDPENLFVVEQTLTKELVEASNILDLRRRFEHHFKGKLVEPYLKDFEKRNDNASNPIDRWDNAEWLFPDPDERARRRTQERRAYVEEKKHYTSTLKATQADANEAQNQAIKAREDLHSYLGIETEKDIHKRKDENILERYLRTRVEQLRAVTEAKAMELDPDLLNPEQSNIKQLAAREVSGQKVKGGKLYRDRMLQVESMLLASEDKTLISRIGWANRYEDKQALIHIMLNSTLDKYELRTIKRIEQSKLSPEDKDFLINDLNKPRMWEQNIERIERIKQSDLWPEDKDFLIIRRVTSMLTTDRKELIDRMEEQDKNLLERIENNNLRNKDKELLKHALDNSTWKAIKGLSDDVLLSDDEKKVVVNAMLHEWLDSSKKILREKRIGTSALDDDPLQGPLLRVIENLQDIQRGEISHQLAQKVQDNLDQFKPPIWAKEGNKLYLTEIKLDVEDFLAGSDSAYRTKLEELLEMATSSQSQADIFQIRANDYAETMTDPQRPLPQGRNDSKVSKDTFIPILDQHFIGADSLERRASANQRDASMNQDWIKELEKWIKNQEQ